MTAPFEPAGKITIAAAAVPPYPRRIDGVTTTTRRS
jgi:hypothetical protein